MLASPLLLYNARLGGISSNCLRTAPEYPMGVLLDLIHPIPIVLPKLR
jgi:hypothetical protein